MAENVTLLEQLKVRLFDCDGQTDRELLMSLCQDADLISKWQTLAVWLGLTEARIAEIKNTKDQEVQKAYNMLQAWISEQGSKANFGKLLSSLSQCGWERLREKTLHNMSRYSEAGTETTTSTRSSVSRGSSPIDLDVLWYTSNDSEENARKRISVSRGTSMHEYMENIPNAEIVPKNKKDEGTQTEVEGEQNQLNNNSFNSLETANLTSTPTKENDTNKPTPPKKGFSFFSWTKKFKETKENDSPMAQSFHGEMVKDDINEPIGMKRSCSTSNLDKIKEEEISVSANKEEQTAQNAQKANQHLSLPQAFERDRRRQDQETQTESQENDNKTPPSKLFGIFPWGRKSPEKEEDEMAKALQGEALQDNSTNLKPSQPESALNETEDEKGDQCVHTVKEPALSLLQDAQLEENSLCNQYCFLCHPGIGPQNIDKYTICEQCIEQHSLPFIAKASINCRKISELNLKYCKELKLCFNHQNDELLAWCHYHNTIHIMSTTPNLIKVQDAKIDGVKGHFIGLLPQNNGHTLYLAANDRVIEFKRVSETPTMGSIRLLHNNRELHVPVNQRANSFCLKDDINFYVLNYSRGMLTYEYEIYHYDINNDAATKVHTIKSSYVPNSTYNRRLNALLVSTSKSSVDVINFAKTPEANVDTSQISVNGWYYLHTDNRSNTFALRDNSSELWWLNTRTMEFELLDTLDLSNSNVNDKLSLTSDRSGNLYMWHDYLKSVIKLNYINSRKNV